MRLERVDQLTLGALIKCVCIDHRPFHSDSPKKGYWLGIVYDIDEDGVVYVRYDDGDLCSYEEDEEVYNENLYLFKEEYVHEQ